MAQEEVVLKLTAEIGNLKKELETVKKGVESIGDSAKKTEKSTGALRKGISGIGLALKAAGIGIALKAFQFLTEALQRNQKIADALSIAFETISIVFNEVSNVLVGVYENVSKSTENFDALGKVLGGALTLVFTPLKLAFFGIKLGIQQAMLAWEDSFFGGGDEGKIAELRADIQETKNDLTDVAVAAVDAGKDIVTNFVEAATEIGDIGTQVVDGIKEISISAAIETATTTKQLQNQTLLAQSQIKGLVEENDRLAETQRQIRDNENATFEERIAANNKLEEILLKQKEDMLALADIAIASAQADLDALDNIENRVALQDAINEKKGIEAQITGFLSEQMTNAVSLENERLEVATQINAEMMSERQKEIEDVRQHYAEQIKLAKKAGIDTTKLEKQKADAIMKIRTAQLMADMDLTAATLGGIASAFGEHTAAYKAIKTVETTISTFTSAQKAFESAAAIPIVGAFLAPIAAASAISVGLQNIAKINSTQVPEMASGGLVGGMGTGSSDSVNARLSRGESVINARSTRMFTPLLSQINEAGGGRAFDSGLDTSANGMTTGVVKAFVVTDDITNSQDKLTKIRRKATI